MTSELAFIAALRRLASHPAARGLNDDCAVLELGSETLILTHDAMAEGVHFLPDQDPADVAWKLVATNMSDLAAKGAEPLGVLLGYMLGRGDARFLEGLEEALAHYNAPLLGGDTISGTGSQVLGLTAIGRATHRPVPSRGGAAGRRCACGSPAQSARRCWGWRRCAATLLLPGQTASPIAARKALLGEGRALAPHVSAMMDVSDGLLLDAARMARASSVTLAIDGAKVPIAAPEARRAEALRWGEDYQLLFTAPPAFQPPVPAHRIGEALPPGAAPLLLDGAALSEADNLGYQHR